MQSSGRWPGFLLLRKVKSMTNENQPPRPKQVHYLKSWPAYFEEVLSGTQQYEIRRADRDFFPGDAVVLSEWSPARVVNAPRGYTGREVRGTILRVTTSQDLGVCAPGAIDERYVVFGVRWELP
jgi:hypothetical protein